MSFSSTFFLPPNAMQSLSIPPESARLCRELLQRGGAAGQLHRHVVVPGAEPGLAGHARPPWSEQHSQQTRNISQHFNRSQQILKIT